MSGYGIARRSIATRRASGFDLTNDLFRRCTQTARAKVTLRAVATGLSFLAVAFGFLPGFDSDAALATPPTPEARLQLPNPDQLERLEPRDGTLSVPIEVRAYRSVSPLKLVVRTLAIETLGRAAFDTASYDVRALDAGEREHLDVRIALTKDQRSYRIEFSLHGESDGREGVIDKRILYQVQDDGSPRLVTHIENRRRQVEHRKKAFDDGLLETPDAPDIGLLSGTLTAVPPERAATIKSYTGPYRLRVRGSGPAAAIQPYILEGPAAERARAALPFPASPGMIETQGQIVFEDFYSNVFGGTPELTPLANATVTLYQRDANLLGPSYFIGETETDEDGYWAINAVPFLAGYPVYYRVRLGNTKWDVIDAAGSDYTWVSVLTDGTDIDFGPQTFTTDAEAAQVFSIIGRGWNHVTTEGGQDPGHIEVRFPDFCVIDRDPDPAVEDLDEVSCWDPADEVVRIQSGYNDSPDVILHEYAHALLHLAFGGVSVGGGAHAFTDLEQDPGVAYNEGWATAFALSVCPDGTFTYHEGDYEAAEEWPACTSNYDYGTWIEGFCHDCDFNANDDPADDNRSGWLHEGRVAAAITDLLDAPNDDNDGTEDRGRNGYEDANDGYRISLASIFRDNMWGFLHQDYIDFYISLQGDLSGTTRSLATEINTYNYAAIPAPTVDLQCVASKVAVAERTDYTTILDGLRGFRDRVLKPLQTGRRWIQSYYSHSPEMAILLIGSAGTRQAAGTIVEYFAGFGHALRDPSGIERLARSREPALPRRVKEAIAEIVQRIDAKGSAELKKELGEARRFLRNFERLTLGEAVRRIAAMKPVKEGRGMPVIQPRNYAPGSRNVDWTLIKQNLPAEELASTQGRQQ